MHRAEADRGHHRRDHEDRARIPGEARDDPRHDAQEEEPVHHLLEERGRDRGRPQGHGGNPLAQHLADGRVHRRQADVRCEVGDAVRGTECNRQQSQPHALAALSRGQRPQARRRRIARHHQPRADHPAADQIVEVHAAGVGDRQGRDECQPCGAHREGRVTGGAIGGDDVQRALLHGRRDSARRT